jgi:hypothetical protein|tara:strand:+ start:483 stop:734 length:252 start_codon:yes stop_codon:yes gene_type:complete
MIKKIKWKNLNYFEKRFLIEDGITNAGLLGGAFIFVIMGQRTLGLAIFVFWVYYSLRLKKRKFKGLEEKESMYFANIGEPARG